MSIALLTTLSCTRQPAAALDTLQLYILSPHGADIRREFTNAFTRWHLDHYHQPVIVNWPTVGSGGTSDIAKYLTIASEQHKDPGIDLVFGGGSATFAQFAANHFLAAPPAIAVADKTFPKDPLSLVPQTIHGQPLHGPDDVWIAATMSSFGITINKDRIAELHLPTPHHWQDLTTPAWFGKLSLADPSKSGSVKTSYEQIFQAYGFEKGWAVLSLLFANAAMVRDGGANPAEDVGSAEAVAGIVIDFFGRLHITRAGPSIVGFVMPEGESSLDADPIGMLKNAPHPELAGRFIRFVVSEEGQRLWTFKPGPGAGSGAPKKNALGRLSVLPSLYQNESTYMLDPANPFTAAKPLVVNAKLQSIRNKFIGDLLKAALVDNQLALARARQAIHAAGDPPDLLSALQAVPTFSRTTIDGAGVLVFSPPEPLTTETQPALADEYVSTAKEKSPFTERIQTTQRDTWRRSFQTRFQDLEAQARSRITPH